MIKIGDKTYLASPSEKVPLPEGSILIRLVPCFPLSVFGYGWHESTQEFVRLIENEDVSGKSFLDIGCGSGILAILAKKMGASKVVAIDNDWQVVKIAKENVEVNEVDIEVIYEDFRNFDQNKFDIVLCSIDAKDVEKGIRRK